MTSFTDKAFGFSFWYPASWKVVDKPVTDQTRNGWFRDARIVRELQIVNPARANDDNQPAGVTLEEVSAPAGLTELGRSKSPSPVGVDQRYFFDRTSQQWMVAQLSPAPDGTPPRTVPVNLDRRTMGGLPLFYGAVRGGGEVIVPLDTSHFLAIYPTASPSQSHVYLAATVVAHGLHPATKSNEQLQTETIRQEALRLQAPAKGSQPGS